ncbi:rhamnulose-1-phosphate aldolase [Chloroflexota bacterium]
MAQTLAPQLQTTVEDIADISRYVWESGWSAANGGNLTVDVTELVPESMTEDPGARELPLPFVVPALAGHSMFVTVSGERFRDIPKHPEKGLILIHVLPDGDSCQVLWGGEGGGRPTSELAAHLRIHEHLRERNATQRVVLHAHPTHVIAMTHLPEFRTSDFVRVLEVSLSTAYVFLHEGIGMVGPEQMGSTTLAHETVSLLEGRRMVLWERHGCVAIGDDVFEAFDLTDMMEKASEIFLACVGAGYEPKRMTAREIAELRGRE